MSEPSAASSPRSWIAHVLAPGRHGAAGDAPLSITERRVSVAQVATRKGRETELAGAVKAAFGSEPPAAGRTLLQGDITTVWIAPGTWLVIEPWKSEGALAQRLEARLGQAASIADQTYGKAVIRLSGARAREVLAKGCRIDLHPRVFGPGSSTVSPIAHINAVLIQVDATPSFDLVLPATLAESLLHWLKESAAEFGFVTGG